MMVSHITGRTRHEEASPTTSSFNIVMWIRARRHQWLGHILRMFVVDGPKKADNNETLKQAVQHIYNHPTQGDFMMDAPKTNSWTDLVKFAADKKKWQKQTNILKAKAWPKERQQQQQQNKATPPTTITTTTPDSTPTPRKRVKQKTPDTRYAKRAQRYMLRDRRSKIFHDFLRKQSKRSPQKMQTTTVNYSNTTIKSKRKHTPSSAQRAHRYVRRDQHELFIKGRLRARIRKPKAGAKAPSLTDKQRAKQAKEHYEQHHPMSTPSPSLWAAAAPYPSSSTTPSPSLWVAAAPYPSSSSPSPSNTSTSFFAYSPIRIYGHQYNDTLSVPTRLSLSLSSPPAVLNYDNIEMEKTQPPT